MFRSSWGLWHQWWLQHLQRVYTAWVASWEALWTWQINKEGTPAHKFRSYLRNCQVFLWQAVCYKKWTMNHLRNNKTQEQMSRSIMSNWQSELIFNYSLLAIDWMQHRSASIIMLTVKFRQSELNEWWRILINAIVKMKCNLSEPELCVFF